MINDPKVGAFNAQFQIRTDEAWLTRVDDWRAINRVPRIMSRSEAIRHLVDQAIESKVTRP